MYCVIARLISTITILQCQGILKRLHKYAPAIVQFVFDATLKAVDETTELASGNLKNTTKHSHLLLSNMYLKLCYIDDSYLVEHSST